MIFDIKILPMTPTIVKNRTTIHKLITGNSQLDTGSPSGLIAGSNFSTPLHNGNLRGQF